MNEHLRHVYERTIEIYRADERILAAWEYGSIGKGTADQYSDVDPVFVVRDEDFPAEPAAVIEDRVGVQASTGVNLPVSRASGVSDSLARSLAALRGGDRVVNLRFGRAGKKSGMMLLGSVESADGAYSITARVVSVKDSRILFYDSETAVSEQDLDGACDRLAKKIFAAIQ